MSGSVSRLVGHGKTFTADQLTTGHLPELASALGQRTSQGPNEGRATSFRASARALLHFHLGSISTLNGHFGATTENPLSVQMGGTCSSQPVSPVWLQKPALLSILTAGRFHLCLHLNVLFKRPLIPGTK